MTTKRQRPLRISLEMYLYLEDRQAGLCLECGEELELTEPDAQHYYCDGCGSNRVVGCDWFLERDLVDDDDLQDTLHGRTL